MNDETIEQTPEPHLEDGLTPFQAVNLLFDQVAERGTSATGHHSSGEPEMRDLTGGRE